MRALTPTLFRKRERGPKSPTRAARVRARSPAGSPTSREKEDHERSSPMKLENKVAIVTGGARGIGEAIVRSYAAEGAHAVIADVETAKADALASELGGKSLAIRLDVRDQASIDAMVDAVVSKLGGVDILVNN